MKPVLCPWCDAPLPSGHVPSALCPSCMRAPDQHPSARGSSKGMDLELELGSEPPKSGRAVAIPKAPAVPAETRATEPDALPTDDEAAPSLDISLSKSEPPPRLTPAGASPRPRLAAVGGVASADAPPSSRRAAPTSLANEPSDVEVRELARYGPEPASFIETLRYAWRVPPRRRALRALYQQHTEIHRGAVRNLKERLADLVYPLRAKKAPELDAILLPLVDADRLIETRSGELAQRREQDSAQIGELLAEVAQREQDREQAEKDRAAQQIQLEDCLQHETRAKKALERIEMELARLHEEAAQAAGEGAKFAPPEHARRITKAQEHRHAADAELGRRKHAVGAAKDTLAARERAVREIERLIQSLRDRRGQLERAATQSQSAGADSVRRAEEERLDAYHAALRRVVDEQAQHLDKDAHAAIVRIEDDLRVADRELEKHRRAVGAYDADAFRKGVTVQAAAVILLVAALVLAVAVR